MMKNVVRTCLVVVGISGISGTLLWVEMPKTAWATVNALGRWDFNDDPHSPSNDGVEDVAGLPAPDYDGDASSGVQRCSEVSASTPKGTGDCIKLSDSDNSENEANDYVAGDPGEHIFPESCTDCGYYSGSRSIAAWIRVGTEHGAGGDRAIVHIGHDDEESNAKCEGDGDEDCKGFHLFLRDGQPVFGNGQGGNSANATIACSSSGTDLDSAANYDSWFFVVGTYDHGKAEDPAAPVSTIIYVNGTSCATGDIYHPRTARDETSRWAIGGFISAGGGIKNYDYYVGYLDDVRIFDRAMGATEIGTLYNNSSNGG